jgi:hypothetical protein
MHDVASTWGRLCPYKRLRDISKDETWSHLKAMIKARLRTPLPVVKVKSLLFGDWWN